jgi:arsenate reductase
MKSILLPVILIGFFNMEAQDKKILFVCEQGTSKSMIAASYFNKLAEERKLPWRAESCGTNPTDTIPDKVLDGLRSDRVQIVSTKTRKAQQSDIDKADKVILFYSLPANLKSNNKTSLWNNMPSVSEDYGKARDAITLKVKHLIDSLAKQ